MDLVARLKLSVPLIQAPMAGTSTPGMAAAVSNAGALGSIAVGTLTPQAAARDIAQVRAATDRAFNVNLFVHAPPGTDPAREAAWLDALRPLFTAFGAQPPIALETIYPTFSGNAEMLSTLVDLAPPVISFHFGLPDAGAVAALKSAGCVLLATATSPDEALLAKEAGIDALVAQGWEAGGHRGMFDPTAPDDRLGTMALTRLLVSRSGMPVIAAGGIMDGHGIRAALDLGAIAAQLGTAFVACPESSADEAYRTALAGVAAQHTTMLDAISGRPARCLANRFTTFADTASLPPVAAYPRAYHAGKALNAVAKAAGEGGFGAQWAGQGAPLSRPVPAADLVALLAEELAASR
ncbi:NAD(P)H-dependent flavin oxidoreductase [Novosphingobium mangrovi (ex Huang et al. 2023)]|uniref:Propionate 3-nitronate monooxygenase n=1 Tax=Novosphingobium mangrovi (ex Huang et al. 2023) TaxID=2976432 RepID=A0ABT2I4N1_9SPHN|nr:nitronate monooxygenase [Novosphingobium mangrovi (ex Huang et al. 2023)]MCT2399745.1 nitronate monooxygenase [Novosphingobium mangrovi (ex Huang et al. 2023)]